MAKRKFKNSDFTKLSENINALMEHCGIDATELSRQTYLPPSTICRLRSNTTECSPNLSSLLPIADFFRITLSQLIGEEPIDPTLYGSFKPHKVTKLPVPVLNAENLDGFLKNNSLDHIEFIDIDISASSKTFAFVLKGNAMEPQFSDSMLLIIDPEITIENLDHVLVIPAGKKIPIFRQILIDGEDKYIRALNPAFNEFSKFDEENYTLLGVMIQARMNYKSKYLT